MTIPTTSVGPVVAYLISAIETQLKTDANGSSILLTLADAGDANDEESEIVSFGKIVRAVDPAEFVGSGGQGWLDEKYDITCGVSVWTGSSDTDGATTIQVQQVQRAWQLYSYVETAIRLDPGLGTKSDGSPLVQVAYPRSVTQNEPEWTTEAVGLLVEIAFLIHVENLS